MEKLSEMGYNVDAKGFYDINRNRKVWRRVSFHNVYPVTINNENFYFKQNPMRGRLSFINKDHRAIAGGDIFLVSEIYYSKLAKMFGINSVDYSLAKINGKKGVISNDFAGMQKGESCLLSEIYRENHIVSARGDLKNLCDSKILESCDDIVKDQMDTLSLFDCVTGQIDRHSGNIAMARDGCDKFNKVISLDCANNIISYLWKFSDKQFAEVLPNKLNYSLGIEKTDCGIQRYLYDVESSEYIRGKNIEKFLTNLKSGLNNDRYISDIHNEVVSEYRVKDKGLLNRFESRLGHVMGYCGELLDDAYSQRNVCQKEEM